VLAMPTAILRLRVLEVMTIRPWIVWYNSGLPGSMHRTPGTMARLICRNSLSPADRDRGLGCAGASAGQAGPARCQKRQDSRCRAYCALVRGRR